jgi:putative endonuclease
MSYVVYMLRCADATFYTGVTTDVERRLTEHNTSKKGAAYTKARRPVSFWYSEAQPDRSTALRREYVLRKLSHQEKKALAHG